MVYKKIEPKVWKPENKGDFIEGILISKAPSSKFPETQQYIIINAAEENITVYGTTILDDRMAAIKISSKIKIVFNGLEQNKKKQDVKMFDVFVDDGKPEVVKI